VARDYDKALKKEAMAKEKARKHKIDFDKANEEFLKAREERKEIQERMRKASLACAQGLRDPDTSEENEESRKECKICLEEYNRDEREESVLLCGHRSCLKCLSDLPSKLCPFCRKEFNEEQIIKLI